MTRVLLLISAFYLAIVAQKAVACETPKDFLRLRLGLVAEINHIRKEKGLIPLSAAGALNDAAQDHACDMQRNRFFDHQAPSGPNLGERVKKRGYQFRLVVENIALTPRSQVGAVTKIWMSSAPHRKNILNPDLTEIGFGIATQGNRTLWVMNGGAPNGG